MRHSRHSTLWFLCRIRHRSHLLAGVLSRATGESALSFGNRNLFGPLGITNLRWDTDPRGNYVGGFHMYFTPRDLARFGYLALRRGVWEDRQLVPRAWIEDSTAAHISYASDTTIGDYGFHWWNRSQSGYPAFMASGRGGQYIFVVPGLDVVMVSTADFAADTIDLHMQAFNLLSQYVIPAIRAVTEPQVAASPHIDAVVNGASFSSSPSPGGWATITGANLALSTRAWSDADLPGGNLPLQLDGVAVTIGGKPAYIGYISPTQINAIVPASLPPGRTNVVVTSAPGHTGSAKFTLDEASPALFTRDNRFAVGWHADYTPILPATPARPGETILLYATGFGDAGAPSSIGEIAREAIRLPEVPQATVAGTPATVEYAGLLPSSAAVVQLNVRLPESTTDGDVSISVQYRGVASPTVYLPTRR